MANASEDRASGTMDKLTGKVKEGLGNLTGDDQMKGEGKFDQVKGQATNAKGDAQDKVQEGVDQGKGFLNRAKESMSGDSNSR